MSGSNFLVDTNFLIYLLNGHVSIVPYLNNNFFISEITEMEMLGVKGLPASVIKTRADLIDNCFIVNFNSDIKKIAITIRQQVSITLPDAIVASSALYMGMPLVTGDKDFEGIPDLNLKLLKL